MSLFGSNTLIWEEHIKVQDVFMNSMPNLSVVFYRNMIDNGCIKTWYKNMESNRILGKNLKPNSRRQELLVDQPAICTIAK